MADPPPSQTELSITNQSTFILWFHNCYAGCESSWHTPPQSPDITYLLSSFEDDLFADTSTLNAKDVKIWRLDLLSNSDGDETKRSQKQGDVMASVERVEGWLNSIEKECEKLFDGFTTPYIFYNPNDTNPSRQGGTHIFNNPTNTINSLPAGYALMHITRDDQKNRQGDLYLWGHPSGKEFNSAKKFVVHLKWLVDGKKGECGCVLCSPPPPKPKKAKKEEEEEEE